jgi:hypothetical protein
MKRASIVLAAAMIAGTASVTIMAPAADAKKSTQDSSSLIHKGMTLDEVEQAAGGAANAVGAPRNGVQDYRISIRQDTGDGGTNDHPVVTVYMFGVKDGKVTFVHKQK